MLPTVIYNKYELCYKNIILCNISIIILFEIAKPIHIFPIHYLTTSLCLPTLHLFNDPINNIHVGVESKIFVKLVLQ